jgi:hypothetical protein
MHEQEVGFAGHQLVVHREPGGICRWLGRFMVRDRVEAGRRCHARERVCRFQPARESHCTDLDQIRRLTVA